MVSPWKQTDPGPEPWEAEHRGLLRSTVSACSSELLRPRGTQKGVGRRKPFSPLSIRAVRTVVVAARHFFLASLCCCHLQQLTPRA